MTVSGLTSDEDHDFAVVSSSKGPGRHTESCAAREKHCRSARSTSWTVAHLTPEVTRGSATSVGGFQNFVFSSASISSSETYSLYNGGPA